MMVPDCARRLLTAVEDLRNKLTVRFLKTSFIRNIYLYNNKGC